MHSCMQAFTVMGCRKVEAQYVSNYWLHFNELLEILLNLAIWFLSIIMITGTLIAHWLTICQFQLYL